MSATPKPYAPPTLTLLTGQTTDEVLAASHALVTLVEERKARSGLSGEFSPRYVDRELCDAVLGYVKLVCNLLDSLPTSPPSAAHDTDRPPADPTLTTCATCDGTGHVGSMVCAECYGVGAT